MRREHDPWAAVGKPLTLTQQVLRALVAAPPPPVTQERRPALSEARVSMFRDSNTRVRLIDPKGSQPATLRLVL